MSDNYTPNTIKNNNIYCCNFQFYMEDPWHEQRGGFVVNGDVKIKNKNEKKDLKEKYHQHFLKP